MFKRLLIVVGVFCLLWLIFKSTDSRLREKLAKKGMKKELRYVNIAVVLLVILVEGTYLFKPYDFIRKLTGQMPWNCYFHIADNIEDISIENLSFENIETGKRFTVLDDYYVKWFTDQYGIKNSSLKNYDYYTSSHPEFYFNLKPGEYKIYYRTRNINDRKIQEENWFPGTIKAERCFTCGLILNKNGLEITEYIKK